MFRNIFLSKYGSKTKVMSEHIKNVTIKWKERMSFELPEKYKGGKIEKLYLYWKNLTNDYKDVAVDTAKEIHLKPLKALIIFSGLGFARYCAKRNPDEQSFRDQLLNSEHDILLLGDSVRNETAEQHLVGLEQYYNEGRIRRFSFGVFSVMWFDNYNQKCNLFETRCSYLKPQYLKLHERVIDVGFLNHWWILSKKMINFDINNKEWS